jgi:hypothetical protein
MTIKYDKIPVHYRDPFRQYIEKGAQPADLFTESVLLNSLVVAFASADDHCRERMGHIASWLVEDCPGAAWGSHAKIQNWIKRGGLKGQEGEMRRNQSSVSIR